MRKYICPSNKKLCIFPPQTHIPSLKAAISYPVWIFSCLTLIDLTVNMLFQLNTIFPDVSAAVLYDVLHDPVYRSKWDHYMIEIKDIGHLNPNNSINYYARKSPLMVSVLFKLPSGNFHRRNNRIKPLNFCFSFV